MSVVVFPCRIPWQGDRNNIISQYDVRMHMDIIPDYSKLPETKSVRITIAYVTSMDTAVFTGKAIMQSLKLCLSVI